MTENLKFHIVRYSSEDENHPIHLIYNFNQSSPGWQSKRLCNYPQEIVIQFEGDVNIKVMKILSHEFKIAKMIEVYIGSFKESADKIQVFDEKQVQYKRIGYLRLDPNKESNYRARELKKINIDIQCCVMKLLVHECHVNALNLLNQVGIVGLQFFGSVIVKFPPKLLLPFENREVPSINLEELKPRPKPLNSEDEIDPETAQKIRELIFLKEKAVEIEDYMEAHKLKQAIEHLKRVSVQLGELEKKKRVAVELEMYDEAARLKRAIEKLRDSYQRSYSATSSAVESARSRPQTSSKEEPSYHIRGSKKSEYDEIPIKQQNFEEEHSINDSIPNKKVMKSPFMQSTPPKDIPYDEIPIKGNPAGKYSVNPYEAYDNRPVGGIRHVPENDESMEHEQDDATKEYNNEDDDPSTYKEMIPVMDNSMSSDNYLNVSKCPEWELEMIDYVKRNSDKEPEPLSKDRDYTRAIEVFGNFIVHCLFSKNYRELRESAIRAIIKNLEKLPAKKDSILIASCFYLQKGLKDPIPQVYYAAVDLLQNVIVYCSGVKRSIAQNAVDPLIDLLLIKASDKNSRIQKTSIDMIMKLVNQKNVGISLIAKHLQKPQGKKKGPSLHIKLVLLKKLIPIYKFEKSGLKVNDVMRLVEDGLNNPKKEVRSEAIDVAVEVGKTNPSICVQSKYLSKLTNQGIINALQAALEKHGLPVKRDEKDKKTQQKEAPPPKKTGELCQFCGRNDFATSEDVDMHYLTECPLLAECELCSSVIDIPNLREHMLNPEECTESGRVVECEVCKQPIYPEQMETHKESDECRPIPPGFVRCPLCWKDLPDTQDAWTKHLMVDYCPFNPRTTDEEEHLEESDQPNLLQSIESVKVD